MKKYLIKKLAGRVEDFDKLDATNIKKTIPKTYIVNYATMSDAVMAFCKDAIKEYIYEHDDESDEIAKNVFGEDYTSKFDGSVDKFIDEIANEIISHLDNTYDLPSELQNIIDKCIKVLDLLDNEEPPQNKEDIVEDEIHDFIVGAKPLGFEKQRYENDILVLEREYKDGILSMALNYEDPFDLYFEGGFEDINHKYKYKEFYSLNDMLEAFKHPDEIEFH